MTEETQNWKGRTDEYGDGHTRRVDEHWCEPRTCAISDLFKYETDSESGQQYIAEVSNYLHHFVAPEWRKTSPGSEQLVMVCFHCGEQLTGMFAGLLGPGGFQWGLTHGEGTCTSCGWPARAMHYAKNSVGEELFSLRNYVLQYHPEEVYEAKKES